MQYDSAHRLASDIRQSEEYQTYHRLKDDVMADETVADGELGTGEGAADDAVAVGGAVDAGVLEDVLGDGHAVQVEGHGRGLGVVAGGDMLPDVGLDGELVARVIDDTSGAYALDIGVRHQQDIALVEADNLSFYVR